MAEAEVSLPARMRREEVFSMERWFCRFEGSVAACWPCRIQEEMSVGVSVAGLKVCVEFSYAVFW